MGGWVRAGFCGHPMLFARGLRYVTDVTDETYTYVTVVTDVTDGRTDGWMDGWTSVTSVTPLIVTYKFTHWFEMGNHCALLPVAATQRPSLIW